MTSWSLSWGLSFDEVSVSLNDQGLDSNRKKTWPPHPLRRCSRLGNPGIIRAARNFPGCLIFYRIVPECRHLPHAGRSCPAGTLQLTLPPFRTSNVCGKENPENFILVRYQYHYLSDFIKYIYLTKAVKRAWDPLCGFRIQAIDRFIRSFTIMPERSRISHDDRKNQSV